MNQGSTDGQGEGKKSGTASTHPNEKCSNAQAVFQDGKGFTLQVTRIPSLFVLG
jgi:hypothetical protein